MHFDFREFQVPKACGVVFASSADGVGKQLDSGAGLDLDYIEWRLDGAVSCADEFKSKLDMVNEMARMMAESGKPVILTLRSSREGGGFAGGVEEYFEVLSKTEEMFRFSFVDVEYAMMDDWKKLVGYDIPVRSGRIIVSHHDFESVPCKMEILELFEAMSKDGAYFVKGAFMAHDFSDSLRLMEAALEFKRRYPSQKLIYMAMGKAGMPTRIISGEAAPAISYASLDRSAVAAPGQLDIEILKGILDLQEKQMKKY